MKQIKNNQFNFDKAQVKMTWTVYDNYNIKKDPKVTIGNPINENLKLTDTDKIIWY